MYTSIAQFEKDWTGHVQSSMRIMKALSQESLNQTAADGFWSLGRIAWHMATTIPEMMSQTGLKVTSIDHKAPMPEKVEDIISGYEKATTELLEQVKKNWTDESLAIEDDLYGEKWKRGSTAQILLHHDIHHRGQMTILMRIAGLKVPGVYGPAKEEWAAFGQEAPE